MTSNTKSYKCEFFLKNYLFVCLIWWSDTHTGWWRKPKDAKTAKIADQRPLHKKFWGGLFTTDTCRISFFPQKTGETSAPNTSLQKLSLDPRPLASWFITSMSIRIWRRLECRPPSAEKKRKQKKVINAKFRFFSKIFEKKCQKTSILEVESVVLFFRFSMVWPHRRIEGTISKMYIFCFWAPTTCARAIDKTKKAINSFFQNLAFIACFFAYKCKVLKPYKCKVLAVDLEKFRVLDFDLEKFRV